MRTKPLAVVTSVLLLLGSDAFAGGPETWEPIAPLPEARNQAIAVTGLSGDVYIVNGYLTGNVLTDSMARYNVATDDYTTLASTPVALRGPCAATVSDGTIVVFDGYISGGANLTHIYDPLTDQWTTGNPGAATNGWECAAAADENDIIHVFGGEAGQTTHSTYDVATDSWQSLSAIPTNRRQHVAVTGSDGRIYVIGGQTTQLDIWDPASNSWSQGTPAPGTNVTATAGLVTDSIIVVGGSSEYNNYVAPYYDSVWVYDIPTDSWDANGVKLPAGRRNPVSGVSGPFIYVFGGATNVPQADAWKGYVSIDTDEDGVDDIDDNCLNTSNTDQSDIDDDGVGDVCDPCPNDPDDDSDSDGFCADEDNCPADPNDGQEDADQDGLGDVCDVCPAEVENDEDMDGLCGADDNCPVDANDGQEDADSDGAGDVCDACPNDADNDVDADSVCGDVDTCPNDPDNDVDGDRVCGDEDNCPAEPNPGQEDADDNGIGDACDIAGDGDGDPGDGDGDPGDGDGDPGDGDGDGDGDTSGESAGDTGESGDAGATGETGPDVVSSDDGCNCSSSDTDAPPIGWTLMLLGAVALRPRRRR